MTASPTPYSEGPALGQWAAAQPTMQSIRDFLEWCDEQKLELAAWTESGRYMLPTAEGREQILARYLGIDLNQLERERRALLESCR